MKILTTKTLTQTSRLNLFQTSFEDKEKNIKQWYWVGRTNKTPAVFIAAIVEEKYLLVIREYRVPSNTYIWSIPAGIIDPNENLMDAAERELKEETGLDLVIPYREPTPLLYSCPGISDESCYIVYCEAKGTLSSEGLENTEDIQAFLMTKNQVTLLLKDYKNVFDCRAYLVFQRFSEHGDI